MCGILGVWSVSGAHCDPDFKYLLETLAPRGPDEVWFSRWKDICYGSTRLAIVDSDTRLSSLSETESTAVLLNGEIWNYRDLAKEYGIVRDICELTVIQALYAQLGPDFVRHLDGVFAIAIIDKIRDQVLVYRDPVGVKPAFWWIDSNGQHVIFSSEAKTICCWPRFKPSINQNYRVNEYVLGFSDYEDNLFEEMRQVPPSSWLRLNREGARILACTHRYESATLRPKAYEASESEQLRILQHAVLRQYEHCERFPIALLLSGGIDSTLLLFIARSLNLTDIVCFYCGRESGQDHLWAQSVAKIAGYELRTFGLTAEQIWADLPEACWSMSGIDSRLPHVFGGIKDLCPEVRIAWSGEGADELYGGYPCYFSAREQFYSWYAKILTLKQQTPLLDRVVEHYQHVQEGADPGVELLEFYKGEQLVNNHLVPHDHAGMAHSMEVRVPFLDLANIEFARTRSLEWLHRGPHKALLKSLVRKLSGISDERFYERPKQGLLHAYVDELRLLRQSAFEASKRSASKMADLDLGPFHRFWYGLVEEIFVYNRGDFPKHRSAGLDRP